MPGMPREASGRLLSIEIENFKSYRGRHHVGPFHAFTAVMGPNGSGKSNLMDAISFVLGVKGAQLRGSLKELLYSYTEAGQEEHRPAEGHVSLVLETAEKGSIQFSRAIVPGRNVDAYVSVYSIDGQTLTWTAYEAKLVTFGILVKARNFLVFQGDIEAVAAKKPEDLTKLFESISGSEAFKADHNRLETECKDADTNFLFVQSRKKSTAAEKKRKREQKEEATKHMAMQEELEKLKSTYYLWQLFHAQKESEQAEKDRREQQQLLKEAAGELRAMEGAVKEKKKEVAGLAKQKILLEQKAKKRQAENEKQDPDQVKASIEMERVAKKIKTQEKEIQVLQAKEVDHERKVADLKKQLADLAAVAKERQARNGQEGEVVSQTTLSRYHQLSEEAKAKTSRDRTALASLQAIQNADQQTLKEQQETLQSITARVAQLRQAAETATQQKAEQEDELKSARQALEAKRQELGQQEIKNRRTKATRLSVEEKLRKLGLELKESRANLKEDERQHESQRMVAEMRRVLQGVHGRVSELAKVTQKSYNLALAVVMGSNIDSVVVEDEKAAKACIAYLKQKRIHPMTFIPLQTIKVHPPNERLRDSLRGIASLALDLLEYNPKLENAFIHICGSTFVCDREEDAKRLAFEGSERHKVVTKSGLLIAKSGAMTGGGTAQLQAKANRFDEAHNASLREERDKLQRELDSLMPEQEGQRVYHQLQNEIKSLETKVKLLEQEIQADRGRAKGNATDIAVLEEKQAEMQPEAEKLMQKVEAQQGRMQRLEDRIHEVEDRIFAPLSEEVGVASIREHLEANLAAVERQDTERTNLTRQTAKIQQQLDYLCKARKPEVGKMQTNLENLRQRLNELQAEEQKAKLAAEEAKKEINSTVQELDHLKVSITKAEKELKELKKEESARTEAGARLHRAVQDLDTKLETLALKQGDVLHMAQLEQVTLPRQDGEDGPMPMEVDETEDDAARVRSAVAHLDFSKLSRQQRGATALPEREAMDSEFLKDIEGRQAKLSHAAPNMKALEQYDEAKAKDDQEKAELEEARRLRMEKAQELLAVRQRRRDAFLTAFNHISAVIDPIYRDLTKSKETQFGGSGFLSLQGSDDECYLHGTSFAVVPPGKRWRQMDELSGGEKTLAALALLFAIQSFQPSPFFVLDEIDAALDAKNVSKVANYIREKTRAEGDFQAVVISLKDTFFSKADSLVGVTKEAQHGSSRTFTLDLNQYGEPET